MISEEEVEKFASALQVLQSEEAGSITIQNGFTMLEANYWAPERKTSIYHLLKWIARKSGKPYRNIAQVNNQYGVFAHRLSDLTGIVPSEATDKDAASWTYTICSDYDRALKAWTLKDSVAMALERVGRVDPRDFETHSPSREIRDDEEPEWLPTISDPMTREQLIDARVGQGVFRSNVMRKWEYRCAVTDVGEERILIASHIKPWAECDSVEDALHPCNGLLLTPLLDRLFDRFLISFDSDRRILFSEDIDLGELSILGIHPDMHLREHCFLSLHEVFLEFHRDRFFSGNGG